jgi:hypothetical protein
VHYPGQVIGRGALGESATVEQQKRHAESARRQDELEPE